MARTKNYRKQVLTMLILEQLGYKEIEVFSEEGFETDKSKSYRYAHPVLKGIVTVTWSSHSKKSKAFFVMIVDRKSAKVLKDCTVEELLSFNEDCIAEQYYIEYVKNEMELNNIY